jgi:hypothetical protein
MRLLPCYSQDSNKVIQEDLHQSRSIESNKYLYPGNSRISEHFTAKISKLDKLRYPPVTSYKELAGRIKSYSTSYDSIDFAFSKIKILQSSIKNHVLTLVFEYNTHIDTAFAYFKIGFDAKGKRTGIQIIPGSGINQSGAMFYNDKKNYQRNIIDLVRNHGDLFIYVKPNEDFLAIHNGAKKISEASFVNYLINNGASFSAYYLIQTLALSKYIKTNYEELYVCGLSQGGSAALLNALQSHPVKAIISSGYSVLMDQPNISGPDQLIIPNYAVLSKSQGLKSRIQNMATQFLFSWGIQESGFYGIDAKEKLTQTFFKELKNAKCIIHGGGHIYPNEGIQNFLGSNAIRPNRNF